MRKITLFIFSLGLLFLTPATFAASKDPSQVERKVVAYGEVVNKDYFATGDVVEISGTVNGDVYAFAGQVLIDGKINGDLISAGGAINLSGEVSQDVRVGGGSIVVSGSIAQNLTVGGGNVEITDGAKIGGSLVAGAGNLTIAGPIGKDILVGAGNLTLASSVKGDINAGVGSVRLTSKAMVGGNLTYWSENQASVDTGAKVTGKIERKTPVVGAKVSSTDLLKVLAGINLFFKIVTLISTFLLGWLLIHFLPRLVDANVAKLKNQPWPSLGIGVLTMIAVPVLVVLFLVSIVGFPLGLMLLSAFLLVVFVSRIYAILWLGREVVARFGRSPHEVWALLVGMIIFGVVSFIPVLGGFVGLFVVLFGLGAFTLTLKDYLAVSRKVSPKSSS